MTDENLPGLTKAPVPAQMYRALILILFVTLIARIPALAQSAEPPAAEPVVLTDEQGEYPLGLHLEILEDPTGELTIEQVSSPEFDSQFVPSQDEVPNYGFTDSAYWVRLTSENETRLTDQWLLEQGFANTHYVDLYTPLPDGEGFAVKQTGVLRPRTTRDIPHPHIIFNLTIPPQEPANLLPALPKRRLDDPAAHPVDAGSVPG